MVARKAFVLLGLACLLPSMACHEKVLSAREGRILFAVREAYPFGQEGVEPTIVLDLETEKIYGCCNFSIESAFRRIGNRLLVGIEGIYMPELCLTALGPAYSSRELVLEPGSYTLEISDGPLRSEFLIDVTDEALSVTTAASAAGLQSPGLAAPLFTSWWRYPRNSFVYLCGTTRNWPGCTTISSRGCGRRPVSGRSSSLPKGSWGIPAPRKATMSIIRPATLYMTTRGGLRRPARPSRPTSGMSSGR